ncbi:MAG: aldo/keto reductase [Candidatus Omnitrophica bacterium]|nr:aldo/keto reductase [Candidatus Omnitrophota bacterium]
MGTWVFGGDVWGGSSPKEAEEAIRCGLDGGINFIDTAPIYGDGLAEEIVGRAIKKAQRHKIVLATKCGIAKRNGIIKIDLSPGAIRREAEDSLKRLGVEQIDLYQCHWPDPNTPIEITLEAMNTLQEEGKIRYIGVSNFDRDSIEKALDFAPIVSVQCQYSLLERRAEENILPCAKGRALGFFAYGPLGGGILSGKYVQAKKFSHEDARHFFYKFYEGEAFKRAQKVIEKVKSLGYPPNETALNWVRLQPGVTSVLVGSRNKEQMRSNLHALQSTLSGKELLELNSLSVHLKTFGGIKS